MNKKFIPCILATFLAAWPIVVFSAVMTSASYQVQLDSMNTGGLASQSTNYASEDTVGEVGSGSSVSASYKVNGGFQQMVDSSISITSPPDITMDSISGFSGGISNGSSTWRVFTDNSTGYTLTVRSTTAPAMRGQSGGSYIADYVPVSADPDFNFSIASNAAVFAYTPEGADLVQRFQDNGVTCNVAGGDTSDACWDSFTTNDVHVASRGTANIPSGTDTVLKYRLGIGAAKFQDSGVYEATIVITATTL